MSPRGRTSARQQLSDILTYQQLGVGVHYFCPIKYRIKGAGGYGDSGYN